MKIKNRKTKGTKRNRISLRSKYFVHNNALGSLNSIVKNNTGIKKNCPWSLINSIVFLIFCLYLFIGNFIESKTTCKGTSCVQIEIKQARFCLPFQKLKTYLYFMPLV